MNLWKRMENPIPIGDLPDDNKMFHRNDMSLTERVIRFLTEGFTKGSLNLPAGNTGNSKEASPEISIS